ncbi:MAG: histidinol dehydrogenase [Hyphomonadaceae bacterium]|nr:MAG: histidinol dehydrogenase [Hyphomonadaceae bacterium]
MARIIFASEPDFAAKFTALISNRLGSFEEASHAAASIISKVKNQGFDALKKMSADFDKFELNQANFKISAEQISSATKSCDAKIIKALEIAAQRIADFHAMSAPKNGYYEDEFGIGLGWNWTAVDAAGLYAPGGKAAYPSSVLMNAIPAKVAGVGRIIMTTPPNRLHENPAILAAAHIAGVSEIYGVGGAQAIAAMAYGAGELAPVDVIVGPGNAYVSAAKKLVFGDVGIDSVAGPSEIYVIADNKNDAKIIACDLLAQSEHDELSQSLLFTDDVAFAREVLAAANAQIAAGDTAPPAKASWGNYGAIIIVDSLSHACDLVNQGAPEHLAIATDNPDALLANIRHAGSIFLGRLTPESLGDYVAGPNHVLPTGRRARFSSGLSVMNFMKRTTLLRANQIGLAQIGPFASVLANAEGLPAHGLSVEMRLRDAN